LRLNHIPMVAWVCTHDRATRATSDSPQQKKNYENGIGMEIVKGHTRRRMIPIGTVIAHVKSPLSNRW